LPKVNLGSFGPAETIERAFTIKKGRLATPETK
jgi:hypothetical protein